MREPKSLLTTVSMLYQGHVYTLRNVDRDPSAGCDSISDASHRRCPPKVLEQPQDVVAGGGWLAFRMYYGSEFVTDRHIEYCLSHGIELTRSRPYRKNDQAWIEQKNGAIVRKLLGYRRFEGLAAARAIMRLYAASRLLVNFFQPSFKLAAKERDGAKVAKRYHPPQTPCERLLQAETIPAGAKDKLREVAAELDPLKLLEEMRAVQAYLAALADGEAPPPMTSEPPNLAAFIASLSSAWHAGEIRPTFSIEAKPRYLRGLQKVAAQDSAA